MAKQTLPKQKYLKGLHKLKSRNQRQAYRQKYNYNRGGGKKPEPPFTEAITNKTLRGEMSAASRLQFGDEEFQLRGERLSHQQQLGRIPGLYETYQARLRDLQAQNAAATQAAQDQIGARATALADNTKANLDQQRQRMEASAQARGARVDPRTQAIATMAENAQQRRQSSFQDKIATQGASQQSGWLARQAHAGAQGLASLEEEGKYGRKISALERDLGKRKGAFAVDYRSKVRQAERNFALERGALNLQGEKLQLEGEKLEETARNNRREDRTTRRGQTLSHLDRVRANQIKSESLRMKTAKEKRDFTAKYGVSPDRFNGWSEAKRRAYLKRNKLLGKTKEKKQPMSNSEYFNKRYDKYRDQGYGKNEAKQKARADQRNRKK